MFDQLVESATVRKKTKRWLYFTTTATVWMLGLMTMIVTGIFAYDARLDSQYEKLVFVAPQPPIANPPAPNPGPRPRAAQRQQMEGLISVPKAPETIAPPSKNPPIMPRDFGAIGDDPVGPGGPPGLGPGGPGISGISDGLNTGGRQIGPPPPPPPSPQPKPETATKPPVIRSSVIQGSAIRRVEPTYPPLAKAVGITGSVVVEVTIDESGAVASARVLSGHPLLRDVCLAAARGWRWKPTLLNGAPVKVVGTITFNFQR
ncbi:MAG TPA: energy transducer TonB [Blastocatellia bacterium]|nr:energy transducer TonB [Blastocatellia bacterium]